MAEIGTAEMTVNVKREYDAPTDPESLQGELSRLEGYVETLDNHLDRLALRVASATRSSDGVMANKMPSDAGTPLTVRVRGLAERMSLLLDRLQDMTDRIDL